MKCTECGFENDDKRLRCEQCDAEIKKSAYVVSVANGLKRLEREKLAFLNDKEIVSKFDEKVVTQYSVMAPLDPEDVEKLVAEQDETQELQSIAAELPELGKLLEGNQRAKTETWSPAEEVSVVLGADATMTFGLAKVPTQQNIAARSDDDSLVSGIQDLDAVDLSSSTKMDIAAVVASPSCLQEKTVCRPTLELAAATKEASAEWEISHKPAGRFDSLLDTLYEEIQDLEASDIVEKKTSFASTDQKTIYEEIQEVSAEDVFEEKTASISEAALRTLYEEVQDVADFVEEGLAASENSGLHTVYEEIQDISSNAVLDSMADKKIREKAGSFTKFEELQEVDGEIIFEEDEPHEPARESVYGLLPVESASLSNETQVNAQVAVAEVTDAEPQKPRARILRHDFRVAPHAKAVAGASPIEKLKAQGVFDPPKAHAEVSRNIDNLIVDNYFPRAELETWNGEIQLDGSNQPLRCNGFVEAESLFVNQDDPSHNDLASSISIGAVSSPAPDNEKLAEIAANIAPKNATTEDDHSIRSRSEDVACPFDAEAERAGDKKIYNDLHKDDLLCSDEKNVRIEVDLQKKSSGKKSKTRQLLVESESDELKPENRPSKTLDAPKISLSEIKLNNPEATPTTVGPLEEIESGHKMAGVVSFIWAFVIACFVVGILYLCYLMGFFAWIHPYFDPHPPKVTPQLAQAPESDIIDQSALVAQAVETASLAFQNTVNYENYLNLHIKQEIEALDNGDLLVDENADQDTFDNKIQLYAFGHAFYPEDLAFETGYIQTLFDAGKFEQVRYFIDNLPRERRFAEEVQAFRLRSFTEDPHFISEPWTITARDFQDLSPLGGGSTVTLKLMQNGKEEAAFKPLQTRLQSNYRAEIAAWRLCELIGCDFKVPYNREVRISYEDFYQLYGRSRSSKAATYRKELADITWRKDVDGKRYVYGTYKEWIPGFTRFPIELTSMWKTWLRADSPIFEFPELSKALSPIAHNQHTSKLFAEILKRSPDLTTEKLAAQISEVLVFDFLLGNWDRFSGVPEWWGVNCQYKDSQIVSIDNGAGFQWGANQKVTERFMMTERFSRHFVDAIRNLDKDLTYSLLFPNPDSKDKASFEQFWKQRGAFLERVDALVHKYGEDVVLAFP